MGARFRKWLEDDWVVLPVLFFPILLFIEPLIKGEALFWGLPSLQFVPWRAFAWEQMSQGYWPLWNPLNGMGAPLLANYQLAFFYPPGWLLGLLKSIGGAPWMAWGEMLLNILHLSWAGIGMVRFLRGLGADRLGQAVSGLAFSMCGFFIVRIGTSSMIWAGTWLPWLMVEGLNFVRRGEEEKRFRFPLVLSILIAMQLFAGHAQLTWYSLILLSAWVIFLLSSKRSFRLLLRGLAGLGAAWCVAVGLTAIQLLPTMEYLLQSQRSGAVEYESGLAYSFWPWRILTLLSANFFGSPADGSYFGYASFWEDAIYLGIFPLILAMLSLFPLFKAIKGKKWQGDDRSKQKLFFWCVILIGLLLALGKNTPIFIFLYQNIPTFDMFNAPARYLIWVEFSIAVLAGLMANKWMELRPRSLKLLKRATVASAAIAIGAIFAWLTIRDVRLTFISATASAAVFLCGFCVFALLLPRREAKRRWWVWIVITVLGVDLCFNWWGLTPTISKEFYGENTEIIALRDDGRLFIESSDEYSIKFSRFFRFGDFRAIEEWGRLRKVLLPNLNLLEGIAMVNNFDPLVPARLSRVMEVYSQLSEVEMDQWLDWMSVGWVITRDVTEPVGVRWIQNDGAERYRWLPCGEIAENMEDALEKTKNKLRVGIKNVVVVELQKKEILEPCRGDGNFEFQVVSSTPISNMVRTISTREGYLLVADTWYPGWRAKIDGVEVEIVRSDTIFYAIRLPAGKHLVEFFYSPTSFYIGQWVSGITLLIVILLVINMRLANRKNKLSS